MLFGVSSPLGLIGFGAWLGVWSLGFWDWLGRWRWLISALGCDRYDRHYRPRLTRLSLDFLQGYAVLFQRRKHGQKPRCGERASFKLGRY